MPVRQRSQTSAPCRCIWSWLRKITQQIQVQFIVHFFNQELSLGLPNISDKQKRMKSEFLQNDSRSKIPVFKEDSVVSCISKLKPESGTSDNFVPTIFIADDTIIGLARQKPNGICLPNVCNEADVSLPYKSNFICSCQQNSCRLQAFGSDCGVALEGASKNLTAILYRTGYSSTIL